MIPLIVSLIHRPKKSSFLVPCPSSPSSDSSFCLLPVYCLLHVQKSFMPALPMITTRLSNKLFSVVHSGIFSQFHVRRKLHISYSGPACLIQKAEFRTLVHVKSWLRCKAPSLIFKQVSISEELTMICMTVWLGFSVLVCLFRAFHFS